MVRRRTLRLQWQGTSVENAGRTTRGGAGSDILALERQRGDSGLSVSAANRYLAAAGHDDKQTPTAALAAQAFDKGGIDELGAVYPDKATSRQLHMQVF